MCLDFDSAIRCMLFRDAWDMAAEICLSQLPQLVLDPSTEFQVCFVLYSFLQLYKTALVLLIKRVPILFLAKSVFYWATDSFWGVAWSWIWA